MRRLIPILAALALGAWASTAVAPPQEGGLVVNPQIPASCLPPGLVPGEAMPPGYVKPPGFLIPPGCAAYRLLVPAPPAEPAPPADPTGPGAAPEDPGALDTPPMEEEPAEEPEPVFDPMMFARLLSLKAVVLGVDEVDGRDVVALDVRRVMGLPRRLRDDGGRLAGYDAYALLGAGVRIVMAGERIGLDELADLDEARVVVRAKMLPEDRWLEDEDGEPTPTFRVRRITVLGG